MDPKYRSKLEDLERRVYEQSGGLDRETRRAAAAGGRVPEPLATYIDKVRRHAYKVTDLDVQALRTAGYSEDQIFEATVAAAYGVARGQLQAGLDAMVAAGLPGAAAKESHR